MGPPCKYFVWVTSVHHGRTKANPAGDTTKKFTRDRCPSCPLLRIMLLLLHFLPLASPSPVPMLLLAAHSPSSSCLRASSARSQLLSPLAHPRLEDGNYVGVLVSKLMRVCHAFDVFFFIEQPKNSWTAGPFQPPNPPRFLIQGQGLWGGAFCPFTKARSYSRFVVLVPPPPPPAPPSPNLGAAREREVFRASRPWFDGRGHQARRGPGGVRRPSHGVNVEAFWHISIFQLFD